MQIVVGLGNPGSSYAPTRHNAGFWFVEAVREAYGFPAWKSQFQGLVSKGKVAGQDVVLLQPQTYMNLSGRSVQPAMAFYKVPLANLWVAHDELDVPMGKLKYKLGGGDAGHNGLKSISGAVGNGYHRLRLGIGRPMGPQPVEDYVLQKFTADEAIQMQTLVAAMTKHLEGLLANPVAEVARLGNAPKKIEEKPAPMLAKAPKA